MRRLKTLWYKTCMALSLVLIRWAGEKPKSRTQELLERSSLSPREAKELDGLLRDEVNIMR